MTTNTNFTPEEWWLLKETPLRVGGAVMVAADSGTRGTLQEIIANATAIADGIEFYPNDELLQAILNPDNQSTYKPPRQETTGANREARQDQLKTDALDKCHRVAELLKQKATASEANEYKEWVLKIGESVAGAAKEGGVMGIGAKTISPEEIVVLQHVAEALGVASYTPPAAK